MTLNSQQLSKDVLQNVELKPLYPPEECQLSAVALCANVESPLTLTFTVSLFSGHVVRGSPADTGAVCIGGECE